MRAWKSESELAAMLKARGMAGRKIVLSADTALFVGLKMETASKKPTVDEVARELCRRGCTAWVAVAAIRLM